MAILRYHDITIFLYFGIPVFRYFGITVFRYSEILDPPKNTPNNS